MSREPLAWNSACPFSTPPSIALGDLRGEPALCEGPLKSSSENRSANTFLALLCSRLQACREPLLPRASLGFRQIWPGGPPISDTSLILQRLPSAEVDMPHSGNPFTAISSSCLRSPMSGEPRFAETLISNLFRGGLVFARGYIHARSAAYFALGCAPTYLSSKFANKVFGLIFMGMAFHASCHPRPSPPISYRGARFSFALNHAW